MILLSQLNIMNCQDLETLTKRVAFIKAVYSGSLKVVNRPQKEILIDIKSMNLDPCSLSCRYGILLSRTLRSLKKR